MATKGKVKQARDELDKMADKPLRYVFFSRYTAFYVIAYTAACLAVGFLLGKGW